MNNYLLSCIAIIATVFFDGIFMEWSYRYVEQVYDIHKDEEPLKTYFALYGYTYWLAAVTFLCLVVFAECLKLAAYCNLWYLAACVLYWIAIKLFAKITKASYMGAKAREKKLQEFLSE